MAERVGDKAMRGELEYIAGREFEIAENMTMTFEGFSCNIMDKDDKPYDNLSTKDGPVTRNVQAGDRCFIMKAWVRFEKR